MRRFLKEEEGSATLLLLLILTIVIMAIAMLFLRMNGAVNMQSNISDQLSQSMTIVVSEVSRRPNMRDNTIKLDQVLIKNAVETRLLKLGLVKINDSTWSAANNTFKLGDLTYELAGGGKLLEIRATMITPAPYRAWGGGYQDLEYPVYAKAHLTVKRPLGDTL